MLPLLAVLVCILALIEQTLFGTPWLLYAAFTLICLNIVIWTINKLED